MPLPQRTVTASIPIMFRHLAHTLPCPRPVATLLPCRFAMLTVAQRAATICATLDRDDDPAGAGAGPCKRQRFWSTADYEPTHALGEGTFGAVVEAWHRGTGQAVAVKALRTPAPPAGAPARSSAEAADEVLREVEFLAACRGHPSLVGLHVLALNLGTGEVTLVMECTGPNLHDVLNDGRHRGGRPFPEDDARRIMWQLLGGARHMHARRIMHRDIKHGEARGGRERREARGRTPARAERSRATVATAASAAPAAAAQEEEQEQVTRSEAEAGRRSRGRRRRRGGGDGAWLGWLLLLVIGESSGVTGAPLERRARGARGRSRRG